MSDMPSGGRCHSQRVAALLGGRLAQLTPGYVTDAEIFRVLENEPEKLERAMEMVFAPGLPTAVIDTGSGQATVSLLADAVFGDRPQQVASTVGATIEDEPKPFVFNEGFDPEKSDAAVERMRERGIGGCELPKHLVDSFDWEEEVRVAREVAGDVEATADKHLRDHIEAVTGTRPLTSLDDEHSAASVEEVKQKRRSGGVELPPETLE